MRHQKLKSKKSKHSKKKYRNNTHKAEYSSYQKNNPLTVYVERVCGVNSTELKKS